MQPERKEITVDLKARLRQYLPILFEFLDIQDFTVDEWQ